MLESIIRLRYLRRTLFEWNRYFSTKNTAIILMLPGIKRSACATNRRSRSSRGKQKNPLVVSWNYQIYFHTFTYNQLIPTTHISTKCVEFFRGIQAVIFKVNNRCKFPIWNSKFYAFTVELYKCSSKTQVMLVSGKPDVSDDFVNNSLLLFPMWV